MNPEESKEAAKNGLGTWLSANGINISKNFSCLNPAHEDHNPSMSFDKRRNRCHCFSCGADYDIFDVAQIQTGLSGRDLFNYVYQKLGIQVEYSSGNFRQENKEKNFNAENNNQEPQIDFASFFKTCHEAVEKTDYWKKRGLSRKTIDAYKLGFWEEKNRFVIPTGEASYNARAIGDVDKKFRYLKPKGVYELFNLRAVETAEEPVFVVEGEIDALSVIEAGGIAVALGSSGSMKFLEYVKHFQPKKPFIISLDNDEAGREGSRKLCAELEKLGIEFAEISITGDCKDANELLVKDREALVQNVRGAKENVLLILEQQKNQELEEYTTTSAAWGLSDFIHEIENRYKRDCISTGFKNADSILDGGFYSGLYIIGAISSLGKTTLALQIADNAAKAGRDVLVFSLEMGRQELTAKSLSRISFERTKNWKLDIRNATTTRNLLNGNAVQTKEQAQFMNEALKDYAAYAGHLYYHIGIGDIGVDKIKEVIAKHIRITGNKPLVVIDYLQILAPFDMRATDKQNTDKAVVELKRASRDFDIPVFAISSFNRENYTSPVNIASFKESGAIEYTSDVLMALQYKGMDFQKNAEGRYEDEKARTARILALRVEQEKQAEIPGKMQNLQLKILKNRNGRKGSVDLDFCPMFNYFEEPKQKEPEWVKK
ncbi:MAG: toprim domain-containing protein [Treponema sp.]|nr:toprim domain-containing protein [Treponema sp.]